jgi:hypothetical protein
MLMLALLLAQTVPAPAPVSTAAETEVSINPAGENGFMIEVLTTESAEIAAEKMKAATAEACKDTGVAKIGMTIVGGSRKTKKAPAKNQILQFVTCKKPAPSP